MSHVPIGIKSPLFIAAAAAIGASGLLTVAAPAQAACKYEFPGSFTLNQSNGFRVEASSLTGQSANGKATVFNNRQQVTDAGDVTGSINGNDVTLTIGWNSGAVGRYNGTVRDNGTVAGDTQNLANPGSTASWESVTALTCTMEAPAPPPVKPPPEVSPPVKLPPEPPDTAPAGGATVTGDVDVYDVPGGEGNIIGILRSGQKVQLQGACNDGWCNVSGPGVPGGSGWVWGELLDS